MSENAITPISNKTLDQIQSHGRDLADGVRGFIESYSAKLMLGEALPTQAAVELASMWEHCLVLNTAVFDALRPEESADRSLTSV
jgi:hypothetical protein